MYAFRVYAICIRQLNIEYAAFITWKKQYEVVFT